jgi:Flp pilus assembly pilin Flp
VFRVNLRRFLFTDRSGATPTEYALLAALVAVVVIGVIVSGTLPK